jgi:hypothetical protein
VPATLYINSTAFTALLTAWVMASSMSAFRVSESVSGEGGLPRVGSNIVEQGAPGAQDRLRLR